MLIDDRICSSRSLTEIWNCPQQLRRSGLLPYQFHASGRRPELFGFLSPYINDLQNQQHIWENNLALGEKNSDFSLGPGVDFGLQHHARFISHSKSRHIETISIFDNSVSQIEGQEWRILDRSSGNPISLEKKLGRLR